MVENRTI